MCIGICEELIKVLTNTFTFLLCIVINFSFEWHDHGIDDHNELAVCKENGFSFYIITFETSVNSQKIASGKKQAVLKCIESCLLPIGDLSEFVQNHGFGMLIKYASELTICPKCLRFFIFVYIFFISFEDHSNHQNS